MNNCKTIASGYEHFCVFGACCPLHVHESSLSNVVGGLRDHVPAWQKAGLFVGKRCLKTQGVWLKNKKHMGEF